MLLYMKKVLYVITLNMIHLIHFAVAKNPYTSAGDATDGLDPWVRKVPWSKEMAAYSHILAWKSPWTEETGGLQSTGSQRVRHD